jgi:hypothetical protein
MDVRRADQATNFVVQWRTQTVRSHDFSKILTLIKTQSSPNMTQSCSSVFPDLVVLCRMSLFVIGLLLSGGDTQLAEVFMASFPGEPGTKCISWRDFCYKCCPHFVLLQ